MPEFSTTRRVRHDAADMFDLVADVERYPEFLPWCIACRIRQRDSESSFTADLVVGFKMVREQFTSRVTLDRPRGILVEYLQGPFEYLRNEWKFSPAPGGTKVEFFLSFEFRSKLLQALIGVLFEEAVRRMVGAFEGRAAQLYGKPKA
jgi:coenzyme Q-binding protein COQ10